MKKQILLFICLLFCVTKINAQTKTPNFKLKELIALASKDDEYFDTYVTGKGFEFTEAKNIDECEAINYDFSASSDRKFRTQSIYKINCENFWTCHWYPGTIKAYTAIKNELKANGFKFIEKTVDEIGGLNFDYKKGNIIVTLGSFENKTSNGDKITSYSIYVKNYK